jgi:gas vesicle protein
MHDRTEYATWILFFAAGSLAGAGAALLLAPQSGRDTRGRVGRRLRRATRALRREARAKDAAPTAAGTVVRG